MQHDDNLTAQRPNFVTHLECAMTGERYEADQIHNLSRAGKPLLVRYDLAGVRKALSKEALAARERLWTWSASCRSPVIAHSRWVTKLGHRAVRLLSCCMTTSTFQFSCS